MDNRIKASLQELQWHQVRNEVAAKNLELAKIIDDIDPPADYTLFKACYPFGSEIVKDGHLYVPNEKGRLTALNSTTLPSDLREKLDYNVGTNPVSLILKNKVEIFIILENTTIPLYGLIQPGRIFSTWRVLNPISTHSPAFIWNMTAGARSLFMLPKISEAVGYNKLRRVFNLQVNKPKMLLDHWGLFKEIANHPEFGEQWNVEIVFFTAKWFECLKDKRWQNFRNYLLERAWEGSEYFRNQFIWDLAFSLIQKQRVIKPNPYIADTVKHILAMGIGAMPGFTAALDNSAAPIYKLQEVFVNIYQLSDYMPIIMQPNFLTSENQRPIYYSLQYPTTIKFSPKSREESTKIFSLYEIKSLLNKYLAEINSNKLNLNRTPIYDLIKKVQYDFFHTDSENYAGIRLSQEIFKEDLTFSQTPATLNKKFPANSSFLRGCVRIALR